MKILALDASGKVASVALAENDKLLGEYTSNTGQTHSQTLLPMVDALQRLTGVELSGVDAIAVAAGPGSFTGLRIGSATAKGLSFAWNKPIVEVPTVDAIAWNMAGADGLVCPVLDARRQQTYTGIYRFAIETENGREADPMTAESGNPRRNTRDELVFPRVCMEAVHEQYATTIAELVDALNALEEKVTFLGDGVPVFQSYIAENLKVPYVFAPLHQRLQSAGSVASLAMRLAEEGRFVSAVHHRPKYLRETQAERERKAGK